MVTLWKHYNFRTGKRYWSKTPPRIKELKRIDSYEEKHRIGRYEPKPRYGFLKYAFKKR